MQTRIQTPYLARLFFWESPVSYISKLGVGKTSIISRYINNTFQSNNMSTTGATFAAKTMYFDNHDKNVKFEIWDTAGQEKYRSLTKIFYKDASVAILVYDICRKQSFEDIKNFWLGQLKEQAPKKLSKFYIYKSYCYRCK
jgi:small GTP-binding protein